MCVIMLVDEGCPRPTEEMIKKAWDTNSEGGGIAWREKNKTTGKMEVVWKKGLQFEEWRKLILKVPIPFVAHARIQTHGGVKDTLCHPFPCDNKGSLALSGKTTGYVLFHNGTWHPWDMKLLEGCAIWKQKVPLGAWSDTRAMAMLCSPEMYGHGYPSLLGQKVIVFGPEDMQIYLGSGKNEWEEINGVWCSNDIFWKRSSSTHSSFSSRQSDFGPMCKWGNCTRRDLDKDQRCPIHPLAKSEVKTSTTVGSSTSNGSGGSQSESSRPFQQGQRSNPGHGLSMALAERLRKENKISKNLIKDLRKVFSKISSGKILKQKDLKKLERLEQATI